MVENLFGRLTAVSGAFLFAALTIPAGMAQELSTSAVAPDDPSVATRPYVRPAQAELERIFHLKEEIRERMGENVPVPAGGPGLPELPSRPTAANDYDTQYPGSPSALLIGRNAKNTIANGADGSTLAEPAAANEGMRVLAAGNFDHFEYSTNAGSTWTAISPPAGPSDAPTLCCDNEVVYDQPRGLWIVSALYTNASVTNGVVRLFVYRTLPSYSCSYTIDQGGTANNVLMDFPHIALSNNYLYLTSNDIVSTGGQNARIRRLNLDNMADCVTASLSTYSWPSTTEGQRVWRAVQGATDTMYFAHHATSTSLRVFSWVETSASPTNVLRTLTASTFANPDCRGGTTNVDWTDSLWSNIVGFNLNGSAGRDNVAWYWNVAADASHPQGHSHGAVFRRYGLTLLAQPAVWNSTGCFGQVTTAMNERGDIGAQVSFGGKSGGGGAAAQGYVGIDDEFTSGLGQFATVTNVASGTHNRTDNRQGDYFTVRQYEPCDLWYGATSYALSGGTGTANVNSRWVEFGRGRDEKCYRRWQNSLATP